MHLPRMMHRKDAIVISLGSVLKLCNFFNPEDIGPNCKKKSKIYLLDRDGMPMCLKTE
jgi:hypothetical protein